MRRAVVIGSGPAGLMAAETMAQAGIDVTVCDAMPSVGRKFLMAGKSGLNITKIEDVATFHAAFTDRQAWLSPMLDCFGPGHVQMWAVELGEGLFTGSTGRVFPDVMKASPLLRKWLTRLKTFGVRFNTRWRWTGWDGAGALTFDTTSGPQTLDADATVLGLGGASWRRLGADGEWSHLLMPLNVPLAPFEPANAALSVPWSPYMDRHLGAALKGISLRAGAFTSRGEAVISRNGLEGGGIYSVVKGVREGHLLLVDLAPDVKIHEITRKLSKPRGKATLSNHLRKTLGLNASKTALLHEMAVPLPAEPGPLAALIKELPICHTGLRPIDEAISTAGGVQQAACDAGLMLKALPGTFVAGEMLDWEAPTGGYLITACLATGAWAGLHALRWMSEKDDVSIS